MSGLPLNFHPVPDAHKVQRSRRGHIHSKLAASLTLAAMSLGYGVVQLDVTIVNTALGSIGTSLGGGVAELQWVVTSYTIAFAALILTAGALGDRIGAKRVFMAGFAIFTAASVACAMAPNAACLIATRAVQGLGAAILVPNSLALLSHAYHDDKQRGRAVAIWAAGASLALTAGPLIGLLVNVAIYGLIFVFSLYFQQVNGWSPLATGLAFVPMMAAVLPVNLVAPRVTERIGAPATIAAGALLSALGCVALLGIEPGSSYWAISAQLVALSTGLGLLVPPLTSTLLGSVEKSRSGIAAGVLNVTRQTGSVLGVALFGSLVGNAGAFMAGVHAALIISASVLLAAAAAIWIGPSMKVS